MNARAFDPGCDGLDEGGVLAELAFVRRLARSLLADENDADDVVQEAWLKARASRAGGAGPGGLRHWFAAVTRRLARDAQRSRARRVVREECAARAESLPSTLDVVERSAHLEHLVHALRALAEPYRSTILLRYLDELSTEEIARATGVSEVAVRKRLSRGLAELRRAFASELGAEPRAALLALAGPLSLPGLAVAGKAAAAGAAPAKAGFLGGLKLTAVGGATAAIVAAVPAAVILLRASGADAGAAPDEALATPPAPVAELETPSTGGEAESALGGGGSSGTSKRRELVFRSGEVQSLHSGIWTKRNGEALPADLEASSIYVIQVQRSTEDERALEVEASHDEPPPRP